MKKSGLHLRRRQLDRQLSELTDFQPTGGWIRLIRESLGLSLESLGQRMSLTRATIHQMERAEIDESISIKRLRAAASALECRLVIRFVPRRSLEETVYIQALNLATAEVDRVNHSMLLEGQAIYDKDRQDLIEQTANSMIERNDQRLWTSK